MHIVTYLFLRYHPPGFSKKGGYIKFELPSVRPDTFCTVILQNCSKHCVTKLCTKLTASTTKGDAISFTRVGLLYTVWPLEYMCKSHLPAKGGPTSLNLLVYQIFTFSSYNSRHLHNHLLDLWFSKDSEMLALHILVWRTAYWFLPLLYKILHCILYRWTFLYLVWWIACLNIYTCTFFQLLYFLLCVMEFSVKITILSFQKKNIVVS